MYERKSDHPPLSSELLRAVRCLRALPRESIVHEPRCTNRLSHLDHLDERPCGKNELSGPRDGSGQLEATRTGGAS
jgi:hypothetical protein